jgi:anti-sigma regulatory factor (Ser/Thr protein kinase)
MNAAAAPSGTTSGLPARVSCLAEPACLPTLLQLLDSYCAQHRVDARCRHDLHLIVEEACVNVIAHAYPPGAPGPLSLQVEIKPCDGRPVMEITIEDRGAPFDPLMLPSPDQTAPLEELPVGGLGVHLIRQLSDRQHYRHDRQRGNVLTVAKFLVPARHD